MHLTLLGGAESAGFTRDLAELLAEGDQLTVVFNTARDMWAHGLKRSPDADALLSTLDSSAARTPTFAVADEIEALGLGPAWLRPSDQDVALQLARTELMQAGFTLTEVTAALAARRGITTRLLPMTDDRVEQHVVAGGTEGSRAIHIEEFLAGPGDQPAQDLVLVADDWKASQEALAAIESSDVIILGPSSLSLTLMPILRTPGLVEAIAASAAPVVDVHVVDKAPASIAALVGNVELKFDLAVKCEPNASAALDKARGLA
ncbi:MAG: 2-phospho-L-lactate transferase CofD family protein [Aeromicrobium sp.]